jgi:hypothetical protein
MILVAVGLAGCGPQMRPVLVMDGETPASRRADVATCRFEGARAAVGIVHAFARADAEDRVFRLCMLARGYREERRLLTWAEYDAAIHEGR